MEIKKLSERKTPVSKWSTTKQKTNSKAYMGERMFEQEKGFGKPEVKPVRRYKIETIDGKKFKVFF